MEGESVSWLSWWWDADWVVRGVFVTLVGLSLLTWWVILYKLWELGRAARRERAAGLALAETEDLAEAARRVPGGSPTAALVEAALRGRADRRVLEDRLGHVARDQRLHLESGMTVLATVGNAAPFIGLLGTVWGIMHALQGLDSDAAVSLEMVAGPVAEALVATAAGLFAAIPAVIGYNMLLRLLRRVSGATEGNVLRILDRQPEAEVRPLVRPAAGA